jgi:hypothetical protein
MPGYRDDKKGEVRRAFREVNPDSYSKAGNDPEVIARLIEIEKRRLELIKKVKAHHKKHEDMWVMMQVHKQITLEAERGQFAVPILKPPADKDPEKQAEFEKQMSRQAFSHRLEIARQNVRAKTTRRLTKLRNP